MNLSLETERLELKPIVGSDHKWFLELNRQASVRNFLWDDQQITDKTSRDIISLNADHFNKSQFGLWKVCQKGSSNPIGYCGLWHFFEENQPQLIYVLQEDYRGQGYAIEMSQRIVHYAFSKLNFNYLLASMDVGHLASEKVAQNLGMKFYIRKVMDGKPTIFYRLEKD